MSHTPRLRTLFVVLLASITVVTGVNLAAQAAGGKSKPVIAGKVTKSGKLTDRPAHEARSGAAPANQGELAPARGHLHQEGRQAQRRPGRRARRGRARDADFRLPAARGRHPGGQPECGLPRPPGRHLPGELCGDDWGPGRNQFGAVLPPPDRWRERDRARVRRDEEYLRHGQLPAERPTPRTERSTFCAQPRQASSSTTPTAAAPSPSPAPTSSSAMPRRRPRERLDRPEDRAAPPRPAADGLARAK